jgi:hypothetical protein
LSERGKEAIFRRYWSALSISRIEELALLPAIEGAIICRSDELFPHWLSMAQAESSESFGPVAFHTGLMLGLFGRSKDLAIEDFRVELLELEKHPNPFVSDAVRDFIRAEGGGMPGLD